VQNLPNVFRLTGLRTLRCNLNTVHSNRLLQCAQQPTTLNRHSPTATGVPVSTPVNSYTPMTPSSPSNRTSKREVLPLGALRHKSSKETTSTQSYQGSISNSSAHSATASLYKDLFGHSPVSHNGQAPSISDHKSFYLLEKSTFRLQNQSQSTISTTRGPKSNRRSQRLKFRSLSLSSAEDDAQASLLFTPIYSWAIDPSPTTDPSPSPNPVDAVQSPPPLYDDLFGGNSGTKNVSTADKPSIRPAYSLPRPTSRTDATSGSSHSLVNLKPSAAEVHTMTPVRALRSFELIKDNELASEEGDIINVVNPWRGQHNGRTGIFPTNYVVRFRSNL
jgi:Variant SH3 domain